MKIRWKSGRVISICSILVFVAIAFSVIAGSIYVNNKIGEQEQAEARRMEYRSLSDSLAEASDDLTSEVRYFAITGDMEHFYNYWYEIYVTQRRNQAIARFESADPPVEEQELLEKAKRYSDLLVETETLSMKLKLLSLGKNRDNGFGGEDTEKSKRMTQYMEQVLDDPLPKELQNLTPQQMKEQAVVLLYDAHYESMKNKIMSPIARFQVLVNKRLDEEVLQQRQQTHFATGIQIISSIVVMIAIAYLMHMMHRLYIWPLQQYTDILKNNEKPLEEETKMIPYGTDEMVSFVNAYNALLDLLYRELQHRREAEEEMRIARNEAEVANEAKGVFLAQVSHELRTPLNAVNGYTYLLEQTPMSEKQSRYVENIRHSSAGLLELINQILDFTKIDSGRLEFDEAAFDVQELVNEVCHILLLKAKEKELQLEWKVEVEETFLIGDPLRLRQVLMNLIGNAIKFTEEGKVEVLVRMEQRNGDGCVLYFEVKDTGIGIEHGMKEKIFEPFSRADASVTRKYGGTGLGLPISSQIIALAGSQTHRLHLSSIPGKGSKFSFRMDFLISKEAVTQDSSEIILWDGTGRKVLLTDDNRINLSIQSELLRLCHLTVLTALSGREAIDKLRTNPDVELIFMDIRMPGMDGYETVRHIREMDGFHDTPIIALTADATDQVISNCIDATMVDCLLKPVEQRALFAMVGKYLKLKTPLATQLRDSLEHAAGGGEEKLFDEESCLKKLSQNAATLQRLLGTFLEFHGEDGVRLGRLLEEQRTQEADELLHLLKGVAGNLCCMPLVHEAEQLRHVLQSGKHHYEQALGQFLGVWNMTLHELQLSYQNDQGKKSDEEGQVTGLSREQLKQLIELCEGRDTEAVTLVEEHALSLSTMMDKESYLILKKSSIRYDFVTMANCLGRLLKKETR